MAKKKQSQKAPPTVITLTLPTLAEDGILQGEDTATLLIQRGDLAHLSQFPYDGQMAALIVAIREASAVLHELEENPPVIAADQPKSKPKSKQAAAQPPPADEEPTLDVPLKKGTKTVRISHLKIVGGESDAAAYKQAVEIAGRLIDGKLWDGESPIRFDDVHAVARKMKHLTDKDFSLFTLEDFVQIGLIEAEVQATAEAEIEPTSDDEPAAQSSLT